MISASDLLHLPYTSTLIEGGIACALRSLPYSFSRLNGSPYERLRRGVASAAVELAFRRYLSDQNIPFEVKSALPFTEHNRYDVVLGRRRCEIKSFLISQRQQISRVQRDPQLLLRAPALIASDGHAAEGHSPRDLYLFAFLIGQAGETERTHYLIHVMPGAWNRPSKWNPLGKLVLKSDSEQTQTLEIGGQDEGRVLHSCTVELPPRTRVEIENGFFSLAYVHTKSAAPARIGIHSPIRRETHIIGARDWGNIWIYGMDILLAGYITREEFSRRASFIPAGSCVFQYMQTKVKNLAVPTSDLRPLSELFEHAKNAAWVTGA